MKIEVTFDKSAKKEFRDQCIKRLQNFVNQIKGKQEASNSRRNSIVSAFQESRGSTFREYNCDNLQQQERILSKPAAKEIKVYRKQNSLAHTESQGSGFTPKESRKQNRIPEQNQTGRDLCEGKKFNICQMRQNVNKILQKLDKNACLLEANHQNMQEKLDLTNRKLDYLIQCIEKKGVTETEISKSRITQQHEQDQRSRVTFQDKFNHLAQKYYEIRQRSARSANHVTSLEQTQDSVTFRQI